MTETVKGIKAIFDEIIKTAPIDSRFPTVNQANHCWNVYNEWALCVKETGGDNESKACAQKRQISMSICPEEWTEKWDEEREDGNFTGIQ